MVLLALSLQDQVEKYGAYVGIASFFGLAALSLLYFAQAREVRRLREWTGRAPELGQRLVEQAEAILRTPPPAPAPSPVAAPVAVAATNGAPRKLKPEEVAALAFARAAGVAEPPHPPKAAPAPEPVAVAAAPAEVAAPPAPVAVPPAPPAEAAPPASNGHGSGDVPPPATPAARRAPVPAAPLRATPPPRRPAAPAPARRAPAGPPPRRETSTRSVVLTALLGVIVLVAVVFAGVQLLGGGGNKPAQRARNPVVTPQTSDTTQGGGQKASTPTPVPRASTSVAVLNGTQKSGLAATAQDRLLTGGYVKEKTSAGNNPEGDRARTTSVVMYKTGARAQARDVARILDIKDVQPLDPAAQAQTDVVVVIGADKAGN